MSCKIVLGESIIEGCEGDGKEGVDSVDNFEPARTWFTRTQPTRITSAAQVACTGSLAAMICVAMRPKILTTLPKYSACARC